MAGTLEGTGARELPLRHALALGLLQGPTELLPVSSSAHTTLLPWLAGWSYGELDPRLRKSFEVTLHAGAAVALLLRAPWDRPHGATGEEHGADAAGASRSVAAQLGFMAAAVIPPALAGYALGPQIERRLGAPATIAAGLLAGSVATGAGELRAGRRRNAASRAGTASVVKRGSGAHVNADARPVESASARDGLALGLAQALALIPGVSRSGATLAAARARGFSRLDADRLSWQVGLPVIAGASVLKGSRLAREGVPSELRLALATGAAGAFASTLAATSVLNPRRRAALLPACTTYRAALALFVVRAMRDNTNKHAHANPKK
jgi:undecaprenyl-diphosphatase